MKHRLAGRCLFALWLMASTGAHALVGVSPAEVNVRSSGQTTAFISYQGLDAGEVTLESFWCAAVQPGVMGGSIAASNPCRPGGLFGRLPCRLDRSCTSRSGPASHLVDLMTVPAAVARRAYQDAARGGDGVYYYVRRFTGGAMGDRYAVVALRMSSGGVGAPLALLDVRIAFEGREGQAAVFDVARDTRVPRFGAHVFYNGGGQLRGRWELVQPGDPAPSELDLLSEAALPPELRLQQRRYLLLERFSVFLMPDGRAYVPGPDPSRLPRLADGPHLLLLRIEASAEPNSLSDMGGGRALAAGGVAAFPLPVLRVHVGGAPLRVPRLADALPAVHLTTPPAGATFGWVDVEGAQLYRLEVQRGSELLLSAFARPGEGAYAAPSWLQPELRSSTRWRVLALDRDGEVIAASAWRAAGFQR